MMHGAYYLSLLHMPIDDGDMLKGQITCLQREYPTIPSQLNEVINRPNYLTGLVGLK